MADNVFNALLMASILLFLAWYARYHWSRRRLYQLAAKRKGPQPLPFIGSALEFTGSTGDFLKNLIAMGRYESGMPVWLGQKLFFGIYDPVHLETILNSPHALEKSELYTHVEVIVGTGLFTAPVPKWKRHRKIIMPTFNQRILDQFVDVFANQAEILLVQLEKVVGKGTIDMCDYISRCSLDIICEAVMGITVNAQTTDSEYMKWVNKSLELVFKKMLMIWYHFDFIFNRTAMSKELYSTVKKMHEFTGAIVKAKREAYQKEAELSKNKMEIDQEPTKRNNFLQQLVEVSATGNNFSDEELREEVDTFMLAGTDTSASVICYTFMMLGMFPDIQEKVYQEVMDVLGQDRSVECKDLGSFRYLERVIKETMRLFPVGHVLGRTTTAEIKLDTFTIPADCSVVLGIIIMHRNAKYWPDPLKFDPDRFLPEEIAKRHPYSWLPFSGGVRNCIGTKYAMMSMKAIIATVIRKYRFSSEDKCIEDIELKADFVLKPSNGYNVSLEFRN